jgi:methylisocitrate lyase
MGVDTISEIKRVLREVPGPHMATLSQAAGPKARSLEELDAAGRRRPSHHSRCSRPRTQRATCSGCSSARISLTPCEQHLIPLADYYDLVGLKAMLGREEAYDKAAAALVAKRAAE